MAGLTKRQKGALKKHTTKHSTSHIRIMRSEMVKGKTFSQAHNIAIKKAGK